MRNDLDIGECGFVRKPESSPFESESEVAALRGLRRAFKPMFDENAVPYNDEARDLPTLLTYHGQYSAFRRLAQPGRERFLSASNAGEVPSIDFFRNEPSVPFVHGSRIFAEGDRGDTMYAVLDGEVELRTGERLLEIVGPGGVFGELALIDTKPRSASAISKTDGRLVEIDRQRFCFWSKIRRSSRSKSCRCSASDCANGRERPAVNYSMSARRPPKAG